MFVHLSSGPLGFKSIVHLEWAHLLRSTFLCSAQINMERMRRWCASCGGRSRKRSWNQGPPRVGQIQSPRKSTSTIRFLRDARFLLGSWKGHHSLKKKGCLLVCLYMECIFLPEMATALCSSLVWATYMKTQTRSVVRQTGKTNLLPAKSRKICLDSE